MNIAQSVRRIWLISLSVLILGGCGWHLRGSLGELDNFGTTYVLSSAPNGELTRTLIKSLKSADVVLVDRSADAEQILRIISESTDRRVLSVVTGGRPREYELHHEVEFSLTDAAGKEVVAPQTLSIQRSYIFDENDVLGKAGEESIIRRDMARELARRVIQRIQIGLRDS